MTLRRMLTAILVLGALALPACNRPEPFTVRAQFVDVSDLVENSSVQVADVRIGTVSDIELTDDYEAIVTMRIDETVALPSSVSAQLRKTNVLGERFVELIPDPTSGGRLQRDTLITDTRLVPDLEDVVRTGSDLLAAVATDKIAGAIEAGAEGLGGRGETFSSVLDDLTEIVTTYDQNSDDIVRLIDGLDQFLSDVGPEAELHGEALRELARAAKALDEEDERLLDTLNDVAALARTGEDIMVTHRERTDVFFDRFNKITKELVRREDDLNQLFTQIYKHNFNTIRGVNSEFGQIFQDFVICGENDTPGDAVRGCDAPPQGVPRPSGRGGGERQ